MKKILSLIISAAIAVSTLILPIAHAEDLVTLYAEDGRSAAFRISEVAAQLTVGWYTEPVQRLYAEGKSHVFKKSEVAAQLTVGWYTEPMQRLYAEGKSKLFKKSEVAAQLTVGWYTTPALKKGDAIQKLKQYAKSNLNYLYHTLTDKYYSNVKFKLTDVSGDDTPELLAIGLYDDVISYIEVYYYKDGKVSRILDCHCQGIYGGSAYPIKYRGKSCILFDSYSSGTGFLQQVTRYNGSDWITEHSSYIKYDWNNGGTFVGYVIDNKFVSEGSFDAFRYELSCSGYASWEFVSANEL